MSTSEELVLEKENLRRHRVDKNQLLMVSIINLLTVCCAIFSMVYYEWIKIFFLTGKEDIKRNSTEHTLWINLLYASDEDNNYLSYFNVQQKICKTEDLSCQAIFYELDFIGKLCFAVFALAFFISLYDAVKLIKYGCAELVTRTKLFQDKSQAVNYKNNFRSFTMIVTYIVGLTLNYFAMINMTNQSIEDYRYGPSFWVFFSSLIAFGLASIWENRKMSKIAQQELIIRLLENEKRMLTNSKDSDGSRSEGLLI